MTSYKNKSFHPFEISFCGFSGSGKTTLIEKLIKKLSKEYTVGYMKHDAHKFQMDKEGKDTDKAKKAGASSVAISSSEGGAILHPKDDMFFLNRVAFVDMDIVLIEGFKNSLMSKILVVGDDENSKSILDKYNSGELIEVIAIVGVGKISPVNSLPYFDRNDIDSISTFLEGLWQTSIDTTPLYGLVLGGGKSSRMGEDKGALEYNGKTQVAYLNDLLSQVVDKSFVSCREEQKDLAHLKDKNLIFDKYLGMGPTGGILSAFSTHPEAAWLVIACDMPFITKESLQQLMTNRNPYKLASCFYNKERNWAEPLFSIYEPKAALKFGHYLANDKRCPRKMINNSDIQIIEIDEQKVLGNVNTPLERENVLEQL